MFDDCPPRSYRQAMVQACGGCGSQFETLDGKYAPDGSIVCGGCGEKLSLAAKQIEKQSAGSSFVGAFGSLLIALLSFVLQQRLIFFLFPLLAMAGGAGTSYTALKNERAREALGWKRLPTIIVGVIALLLGLFSLILSFL